MTPTELRKIAFGGKLGGKAGPLADANGSANAFEPQKEYKHIKSVRAGSGTLKIFIWTTVGLTFLLVGNKNAIVEQWSPAANIFALMGAPVNLKGLEITNRRSVLLEEDGHRILMVEGKIKNVGGSSLKVPELDMNIRGNMSRNLYSWRAPSPRSTLGKGEVITFRTRLIAPPEGAAELRVRFSS